MYVRKKKNKSGKISIQIIDKSTGKYKVIKTIGSSADPVEVERMFALGQTWIKERKRQYEFDFTDEKQVFNKFINGIKQVNIAGVDLLVGRIFDEIGFSKIKGQLFKSLVLARLCYPSSKLKTTDYLWKYHSIKIDVASIYRYMDKLQANEKQKVQQISYEHTLQILGHKISVVFYDVTTLYFEIDSEDDLRKTGFSKDGKHKNPQIVLGLLVSIGGYPLAYEIFEGNKFEGHTMLPVINHFKDKYKLEKLVIVADSGLMSNQNVEDLQENNYDYILGARIKNEKESIKKQILALKLKNGQSAVIDKDEQIRLIITYSASRAKKDEYNRHKGLLKLEKRIKSGKLTKENINNRGYNKYLKLEGETKISIDFEKFEKDRKWDGLKGYQTNTDLTENEIIENYKQLWLIEKAFRISKTDLKIRPIFHRLQNRIEAHICISFVAYKVYKELERKLKEKNSELSPEKAIEIAKTIYSIRVVTPKNKEVINKVLILNEEQQHLMDLFQMDTF